MAARWTIKEDAYLREQAGRSHPKEIAAALGKTEQAVANYARKHGVSMGIIRRPWSESEDEALREAIKAGVKAYDIATDLSRSEKSVTGRIHYLRKKEQAK